MTIYETNYKARLDEMLDNIIRKYGFEHEITIWFAELVEKYYNLPCYHNRERLEIYYKKSDIYYEQLNFDIIGAL